jgi:ribosomal protein S18 acetylase RimI-like enzyme
MIGGMTDVADCERVQLSWFRFQATTLGQPVWEDDGLTWVDGDDAQHLMFPRVVDPAALARGVARAADAGQSLVGAWLSLDVDPTPLAAAGFERGWSPWWMAARIADVVPVGTADDRRVALVGRAGKDAGTGEEPMLALARVDPPRAWCAAAFVEPGRRFAGRAWSYLDDGTAGVFDMAVWPSFRRRGLGTSLLRAVCAAAAGAGARDVVLNATPEGAPLYANAGLRRIGEGITWWRRLDVRGGAHAPAG